MNSDGVRQHVAALYEEVFRDFDLRIFPKSLSHGFITDVIRHFLVLPFGKFNVLSQGYPFATGALWTWLQRDLGLIVHTWKVPGLSDERLTAKINDTLLRRVISSARAVVVVSMTQKRQLESMKISCPVFFARVSVDSQFWHSDAFRSPGVLKKFGLERGAYVLTAGGPDRDEVYAAQVAKLFGLTYVRASWDNNTTKRSIQVLASNNLDAHAQILENPTDIELRSLYANSFLVCLPTLTRTNPAGLTSLVTAMACESVVAVPDSIAEGYVNDGVNGFILSDSPSDFVARLRTKVDTFDSVRRMAREFAQNHLNNFIVARELRSQLSLANILR